MIVTKYWYWPTVIGAIVAAAFLAFGASLHFNFAPIDDHHLIVENLVVREWSAHALRRLWTSFDPELYIPVTLLSFNIEALTYGMHAWGFHLDNLLLHSCNAILVAWVVMKVTGSRIGGLCAALLFVVHPLMTEAVVWISARKDVLATFFALLSLISALTYMDGSKRAMLTLSILLFLLAALSKISVVLLPAVLLIMLMQKHTPKQRIAHSLLPYMCIAVVLGTVAVVGKGSEIGGVPWIERIVFAGYAMSLSLGHFLVPVHLSPYYVVPPMQASTFALATIPLFLLYGAWLARKKMPSVTVGIAWFFAFLLPALFNIQTDIRSSGITFASDRYMYLPSIGLWIVVVTIVMRIGRALDPIIARCAAITITIVAVMLYLPATRAQTQTWSNAVAPFEHAVSVSGASVQARVAYAESLRKEKKLQDAFTMLKEGLRYGDDERLHLEAGILYATAGDVGSAEQQFKTVLRMDAKSPEALYGLARLRHHGGKLDEAQQLYELAITLEPKYVRARIDFATLLLQKGDRAGAMEQLQRVEMLEPGNAEVQAMMHAQ